MPQGIGDVIMTLPVLKELAKSNTFNFSITLKSEIEEEVVRVLCPELEINFVLLQPIIEKFGVITSFFVLIKRIRSISPDIILTQFNVSSAKSSIVSLLAGIKKRVGWKGPFSIFNSLTLIPSGDHKIAENMKSLKLFNLNTNNVKISYPVYQKNSEILTVNWINDILNSRKINIAIGPGSAIKDSHKRWPHSNYALLIKEIINSHKNVNILLVGNESEYQLCDEIKDSVGHHNDILNLAGKTSIKELFYLLSRVDLTITHCNGISHIAGSSGSKIIGIYGPTNYKITGPISEKIVYIKSDLDCSPCFSRNYQTGCGNPICMDQIAVSKVFKKTQSLLNQNNQI
jgi:heptosyltransferase-2